MSTLTPELLFAPYDRWEALRSEAPVTWDPALNGWLVVSYAECAQVQLNEDLFAHPYGRDINPDGFELTAAVMGGPRAVIMLKGDEHRELYRQMLKVISKAADDYREDRIRSLVHRLIDRFAGRGKVDFRREFADPLPIRVIAAILGLDFNDDATMDRCKAWNDDVARWSESFGRAPELEEPGRRAHAGLSDVLRPLIKERRRTPQDDLISAMWETGARLFKDWNEDDVVAQCRLLFFAGSQSTTHLLSNIGYLLFSQDRLREAVVADPSRVPALVEESLRAVAATMYRMRIAQRDTVLGGASVKNGDRVFTVIGAANRDPQRFECPHQIDLERKGIRSHMAFNVGPRACPGSSLARIEAIEAISGIVSRLPDVRLDPAGPPPVFRGDVLTSVSPLHILFTPV